MRTLAITLLLLLGGLGASARHVSIAATEPVRAAARHPGSGLVVEVSAPQVPLELRPSGSIGVEMFRTTEGSGGRLGRWLRADPGGVAARAAPAVRLRLARVSALDFSRRLSSARTGSLSSYSTTCPPPSGA